MLKYLFKICALMLSSLYLAKNFRQYRYLLTKDREEKLFIFNK